MSGRVSDVASDSTEAVLTPDALLKRIRRRLYKVQVRYRMPEQNFEDMLQEAVLVIVAKWEQIKDKEAYLLTTLRYICFKYFRRRRQGLIQYHDPEALEELAGPQGPPQLARHVEMDLRRALSSLDTRHRALVWLGT